MQHQSICRKRNLSIDHFVEELLRARSDRLATVLLQRSLLPIRRKSQLRGDDFQEEYRRTRRVNLEPRLARELGRDLFAGQRHRKDRAGSDFVHTGVFAQDARIDGHFALGRFKWVTGVSKVQADVVNRQIDVRQDHGGALVGRGTRHHRLVAPSAAVMPKNRLRETGALLPSKADRPLTESESGSQRRLLNTASGPSELKHVIYRRPNGSGPGQSRQVPVGHRSGFGVVAGYEPSTERRRQRDRRGGHAERSQDAFTQQRFVILASPERESRAKQAHAEVGVLFLRPDVAARVYEFKNV